MSDAPAQAAATRMPAQDTAGGGQDDPPRMGWLTGLMVLLGVVVGIVVYVGLSAALGLVPIWAGFAFALYWGGILHADMAAMPSALAGSLLGIALGAALHLLPVTYGTAGLVIALTLVAIAVYLLLMRRATVLIHNGTMLFLTVTTIPAVAAGGDFLGMMGAAMLVAALFALGALVSRALASRRSRPAQA